MLFSKSQISLKMIGKYIFLGQYVARRHLNSFLLGKPWKSDSINYIDIFWALKPEFKNPFKPHSFHEVLLK